MTEDRMYTVAARRLMVVLLEEFTIRGGWSLKIERGHDALEVTIRHPDMGRYKRCVSPRTVVDAQISVPRIFAQELRAQVEALT
jgi:hypothetical protein